ncbi:phosphotransferase enzyme family protein [Ethanoligenens harbinense]|uniref:phosphotransferase enzyme family protein n=1 Tax=Ethanoligenens harbinense TaxID=253239 RepID=UPI000EA20B92|nr:serine kinase [Ethanoligenens harbinense]
MCMGFHRFLLYNTSKENAVLRISRPGYHTTDELQAEIQWLEEIRNSTEVRVAAPIRGKDGAFVQTLHSDLSEMLYAGVLYEFLEGETPDENRKEEVLRDFERLGEVTACLHRHTRTWEGAGKLRRGVMDFDALIGDHPLWGRWQDAENLSKDGMMILSRTSDVIRARLDRFGKSRRRFGLIHADLRLANLLVRDDEVQVIDFDDCGFGWYLHDMASAVSFIEDKPITPSLIDAWLAGYRRVETVSEEEEREIPTFIIQRRLQLLAWLTSHADSDPVQELKIGFADGTVALAETYLKQFA